jgi:hypothetical protein
VHVAQMRHTGGSPTCAQIAHRAVDELGRYVMTGHLSNPVAHCRGGECSGVALARLVAAFLLIHFQVQTVWAASDAAFIKNLERTVEKVEATSKDVERSEAAEELADVICEAGIGSSEKVPTALITRIIAFLNTDYDNTRLWVAAALGCLGPQAKAAAPKLLEI